MTVPPWNLTFAEAVEQIRVGDCGRSPVSTEDGDKFAAERLHAKVANWRCRPKGASGDFLVERPVRLETAVRRPRRGDRSSATTVVRGRQPAQRRDRW